MKKILLCLLIASFSSISSAQEEQSQATIVILPVTNGKYLKNSSINIYLNQKMITTFNFGEKLDYTIYSTGRVSMALEIENVGKKTVSIDVVRDSTYYYLLGTLKGKTGFIDKKTADAISSDKKYIRNIVSLEEDITNPVGKLPKVIEKMKLTQGTAFLLNKDGYILTNFHLINGVNKIKVRGIRGDFSTTIEASVIAVDRQNNFALIKGKSKLISYTNPPYTIAPSINTKQEDDAYTLGYPINKDINEELLTTICNVNSLSGFEESISEFKISESVKSGSSGSPLFNKNGEIIGIMNADIESEDIDSVGYAIKSDYLKVFLNQIDEVQLDSIENNLLDLDFSEQIKLISNYIYIIETE